MPRRGDIDDPDATNIRDSQVAKNVLSKSSEVRAAEALHDHPITMKKGFNTCTTCNFPDACNRRQKCFDRG